MPKFSGEILHFNAIRARVNGAGNLDLTLRSVDNVSSSSLTPIPMQTTTDRETVVLCNFRKQMAQLEFGTDAIDEVFIISRLVIYVKPVATGYPQ